MGILTNFLKLLKPEPNDFVDVVKHISENYDKLDKVAETNNQALTNLDNNKLDKGTYPGKASDLKTEIDGKVNRAGDTMLAMLNFQGENIGIALLKKDGTYIGSVYGTETGTVYITNNISGKSIALYQDGGMSIQAENLTTPEKEIISAVNNLNNGKAGLFVWNKTTESPIINNLKEPGIYYLANDNLSPGSPDANRAMMIVNNKDYPYQEWFPYFKPGVRYTRYWNGTTFSNWEKGSCITSTRDKLIIKDMTIQFTTGSPQTFYFDSAFPTACLGVMVGDTQNLVSNVENVQIYNTTRTNFTGTAVSIPEISPVAIAVKVIAIGY
ncbi:pyocin knob domain-containing protein [Fusobacterium varium]|uniref:pyocin knob domain-containing protein n=1 Tax=Fusobacterium varium TaxID=856 RepID=UPI001F168E8E|nr:pyocin knob domain-containing protein [Fusobacterium varium]MCF2672884.1 hypothetical protein [Fusobacterium varium]